MAQILKAPADLSRIQFPKRSVFLAGSIEMGEAENWQEVVEESLAPEPVTILNPRRDDWDSSWVQSIHNKQFREQVGWELRAMEAAAVIGMYFSPGTKSPITLLELGVWAGDPKLMVFCPEGFWRKGNVDIVCVHYPTETARSMDEFIELIKRKLRYAG